MPGSDSPYRQQGVEIITREAVRHLSHNLWPPFHGLDKGNWRNCLYHPIPLQSNKARGRYSLLHQRFIQLFEQYTYTTAADCPNDIRELIRFEVIAETSSRDGKSTIATNMIHMVNNSFSIRRCIILHRQAEVSAKFQ